MMSLYLLPLATALGAHVIVRFVDWACATWQLRLSTRAAQDWEAVHTAATAALATHLAINRYALYEQRPDGTILVLTPLARDDRHPQLPSLSGL